jgi:hypothetical protein
MFTSMLDNSSNIPSGLKAFRNQTPIEIPEYEELERPRTGVEEVQNSHVRCSLYILPYPCCLSRLKPAQDSWGRSTMVTRQNLEADVSVFFFRTFRANSVQVRCCIRATTSPIGTQGAEAESTTQRTTQTATAPITQTGQRTREYAQLGVSRSSGYVVFSCACTSNTVHNWRRR